MPITPAESVGIAAVVTIALGAFKLIERLVGRFNGWRNGNGKDSPGKAAIAEISKSQREIEQGKLCRLHAERLAGVEKGQEGVAKDVTELRGDVSGLREDVHQMDKGLGLLLAKEGLAKVKQ